MTLSAPFRRSPVYVAANVPIRPKGMQIARLAREEGVNPIVDLEGGNLEAEDTDEAVVVGTVATTSLLKLSDGSPLDFRFI